jgi:ligand-binding SRPBCC domain-containing protein
MSFLENGASGGRLTLPPGPPSFRSDFFVDAPLEAVAAFHEGPEALAQLQPPLSGTRFIRVDPLGEQSITEFTMGHWPLRFRWRALHRDVEFGAGFTDVQLSGPMQEWVHRHQYRSTSSTRTLVTDRIWSRHQSGPRSLLSRVVFGRLALTALFRYRAWATRRAVARILSGATG